MARNARSPQVNTRVATSQSPIGPAVTPIYYPAPPSTATTRRQAPRASGNGAYLTPPSSTSKRGGGEGSSSSSSQRIPVNERLPVDERMPDDDDLNDLVDAPDDINALNAVWTSIRRQKESKMAKEKPKVDLQEIANEMVAQAEDPAFDQEMSVLEEAPPPKSLKRQKSIAAYRESSDGRYIVATFDMRGVAKEDIHVKMSFSQRNKPNILLTWASAEITEWEDGGVIYRERLEVICHRTIPLPERTQFKEIYAAMNKEFLVIKYPNMRCIRVDQR
ncbi:hypothetical protein EV715DRAFT_285299 [Schizophyllum commune]